MKKVLALVLAVMMVSVVAFAVPKYATISPASRVEIDEFGLTSNTGIEELIVSGTSTDAPSLRYAIDETGKIKNVRTGVYAKAESDAAAANAEVDFTDSGSVATTTSEQKIKDYVETFTVDEIKEIIKEVKETGTVDGEDIDFWNAVLEAAQHAAGGANPVLSKYVKTIDDMIFRTITDENYTVTSVKVVTGKAYVAGVDISNEKVRLKFVEDLNNTTPKAFDVSFTLKGKGKMIIRSTEELNKYREMVGGTTTKVKGNTATIPSVKFKMTGSVCYGKVTVYLGEYSDEDLDTLQGRPISGTDEISLADDVIAFKRDTDYNIGDVVRSAGSYVADAILTEDYDEGLTLEARVYSGDTLYLGVTYDPDDIVKQLDTGSGDVDFYFFHEDKNFTTLNTNARLIFNETEEGDHVYSYSNGKLTEVGEYDDDEGCIVVETRRLGQYITSDIALTWLDIATSDDVANPDTGANDVVGIATALAAVALVSAAAVSLKK